MNQTKQDSADLTLSFISYLATYGKSYQNRVELDKRAQIFTKNDKLIRDWNMEGNGVTLGHNQFSDWDQSEYKKILKHKRMTTASTT